jgi:SAM-dependent methyltransferase
MAVHLVERYGLQVDAVDMSALMIAAARDRLSRSAAGSRITVHQARAEDFLARTSSPFDLIVAMGASELVTAAGARTDFFASLHHRLPPGGHLLYGDPFWRRPPSPALAAVMIPYGSHSDYIRAGEAAGFQVRGAHESPQADWDDYAWRMAGNVADWVAANADHPGAAPMQAQARFMMDSYLAETRDSMGFGLYLLRRP